MKNNFKFDLDQKADIGVILEGHGHKTTVFKILPIYIHIPNVKDRRWKL